jgi:hypothetical protein
MDGLVCDRDTFKVKCNDREPKIRLCEIDGPEAKQPLEIEFRNYLRFLIQYFGQFLIANRRIRVSRLQGKFATNGKSLVSEYELKTVRTIVDFQNQKSGHYYRNGSRQIRSHRR